MSEIPQIHGCYQITGIRSVHTGKGACIGFSKEAPAKIPTGDVIHFCLLSKDEMKKRINKKQIKGRVCTPLHRTSCTPKEAVILGLGFIRAATLWKAEVERHE